MIRRSGRAAQALAGRFACGHFGPPVGRQTFVVRQRLKSSRLRLRRTIMARAEEHPDVIDEKMAERMVACGWVAAAAAGLYMIAWGLMQPGKGVWMGIAAAVILLALAYGIYRRSRICALLVLINHVIGFSGLLAHASYVSSGEVAIALVLGVLYVLGVVGTFLHHARQFERPA